MVELNERQKLLQKYLDILKQQTVQYDLFSQVD